MSVSRCARVRLLLIALATLTFHSISWAEAPDGPFEIDHRWNQNEKGLWSRKIQLGLQVGLIASVTSLGLAEGNSTRLGRTSWQAIDSMLLTAGVTSVTKVAFSRTRPHSTEDAGKFFQGRGNRSFPSGEVANVAAITMPFMLEYGAENPWLIAVGGTLIAYDATARMKSRGHWQSDVIAGAAIGLGIGYQMHLRKQSLVLAPLEGGMFMGFSRRF